MSAPTTTSTIWTAHPGDWVILEPHGEFFRVLRRTPNELEMQQILKEFQQQGRWGVVVTQVKGVLAG